MGIATKLVKLQEDMQALQIEGCEKRLEIEGHLLDSGEINHIEVKIEIKHQKAQVQSTMEISNQKNAKLGIALG